MTPELQKKIDRSIKLLRLVASQYDGVIKVAYSGGKDSDVILQLTKEAGIKYEAVYKNTTIDPPGTIQHAKDMGATILRPKIPFFKLVEKIGSPTRWSRFCCKVLKEYKDEHEKVVIIGVRRGESRKRAERYKEPTLCRYYGAKKEENRVEQIFPILDWTTEDVAMFLQDRGIKCAPVYYDEGGGVFHPERRLGCMGCPLASRNKRIAQFRQYPKLLRQWCRSANVYLANHPQTKSAQGYKDGYEMLYQQIFHDSNYAEFLQEKHNLFGDFDAKKIMEEYFNTEL